MTGLTSLFAPDTLRTLGWSLLHFVWQGFALAAVASVALTLFRRASTRYIIGVLTLFAMVASVACTIVVLLNSQAAMQATESAATPFIVLTQKTFFAQTVQPALAGAPAVKSLSAQALPLLVEFWLAGVLFFTLRTAGSLIYLERLRRAASLSVAPALLAKCRELQSRLGITRIIRFCECGWLDAPAVIGWFRPVVLLPVRALTGLTEDQIEAVIAHELAHIRRLDAFVNLFQVVVESLLFFHPAVWWLNKRVRIERENCCDDVAVAACGNHLGYARALTTMEEWRATPAFSLAANGSPLAARISRILGVRHATETRTAGLGAGFVCFAAAIVAASLLYGVAHPAAAARIEKVLFTPAAQAVPAPTPKPTPVATPRPMATSLAMRVATAMAAPDPTPRPSPLPAPQPLPQAQEQSSVKSSYIEEMKSVGFDHLDVDELVSLKIQGVTAEYVKQIRAAGFNPGVEEIVGMKIQGVTPEYIKEMRDLGFQPDAEQIVRMKIQGVTPEYVKALAAEGYKLNAEQVTGAKIMGITPEFIQKAKSHGFKDLTMDKLFQLKNADIF